MNKQKLLQTVRAKCGPAFLILLALKIVFSIVGFLILRHWPNIPVFVMDSLNLPSTLYMGDVSCTMCNNFSADILVEPQRVDCDDSDVMLIAMVTSSPSEREIRMTIRKTWGSVREHQGHKIRTYFVIGIENHVEDTRKVSENDKYLTPSPVEFRKYKSENVTNNGFTSKRKRMNVIIASTLQSLQDEIRDYDDVIVLDLKEDYEQRTNKTMVALRWVTEHCGRAEYVMMTNISSFNVLSRFVEYLTPIANKHFIGGQCTTGVYPDRRNASQSYVPQEMYPGSIYPLHASGRSFILSIPAAVEVLSVSSQVKYLPLDDVFVTGSCRAMIGISCSNMPVLMPQSGELISDCDIATQVGNVPSVTNRDDMYRIWNITNSLPFVKRCTREKSYQAHRDIYKERSKWTILAILIALTILLVVLLCTVCHFVKRVRSKELCYKVRGYQKVKDDENFEDIQDIKLT